MKPPHNVQFGDPNVQGLSRHLNDFLYRVLKPISIPFFSCEGAKLAAQYAVVGIVDIPVQDVAGPIAVLTRPHKVGDGSESIYVLRFEQPERVLFRNAGSCGNFFVDVAQATVFNRKPHPILNPPRSTTSATVTIRKTVLINALS